MTEPLRVAFCEDDAQDRALLISCLETSYVDVCWDDYDSGERLLACFIPGKYDLIFLDIFMAEVKGVDAATAIRKLDRTVSLAFTTTSTDYALASYRLRAIAYLEKPLRQEDVNEVLTTVLAKRTTAAYITLPIAGSQRSLPVESIMYFEMRDHRVAIYTQGETLQTGQNIKLDQVEPLLPEYFFRCHHSYLVNLHYVKQLDRELAVFIMQDGGRVHIRRREVSRALRAYENALFAGTRGENL